MVYLFVLDETVNDKTNVHVQSHQMIYHWLFQGHFFVMVNLFDLNKFVHVKCTKSPSILLRLF